MAYRNLQDFVAALEAAGELIRVKAFVNSDLEISEIASRVMKSPGGGKALLFENVEGFDMPVLINAVGSDKRMLMALGVDSLRRNGASDSETPYHKSAGRASWRNFAGFLRWPGSRGLPQRKSNSASVRKWSRLAKK